MLAIPSEAPLFPAPSMSEGIAIVTSGGDAAGMNPAVKCAAEYAMDPSILMLCQPRAE